MLRHGGCRALWMMVTGRPWSQAEHKHCPPAFKAAVRTLLLAERRCWPAPREQWWSRSRTCWPDCRLVCVWEFLCGEALRHKQHRDVIISSGGRRVLFPSWVRSGD